MKRRLPLCATSLLFGMCTAFSAQADVVTSVKPLGLIAAALTENVTNVSVLVPNGASPHHYALKPSDMRKLADADQIFWVGPQLEHFLERPITRVNAPTLELASVVDMKLKGEEMRTADPDAVDEEHEHGHEHADHDHDGHDHDEHAHHHDHEGVEGMDEHPWLDPDKVKPMAQQMAKVLEERYPDKADTIRANLKHFDDRLAEVDSEVSAKLAPYSKEGFYVFHDAYQSFGEHYNLNLLGYITVAPGRQPGARHLTAIRKALQENQAVCVFSEPQVTPAVVKTLTAGTDVNIEPLDPLAVEIKMDADGYLNFLESLGASVESCLKR